MCRFALSIVLLFCFVLHVIPCREATFRYVTSGMPAVELGL
jgi:hypothetical protein